MRVLLDEQIDGRLKRAFDPEHRVETVRERGWVGRRNGELLRAAAPAFDVLLTMDRGIEYQQNLSDFGIAVILIRARSNRRRDVEPAMPEVNRVLRGVKVGVLYHVTA